MGQSDRGESGRIPRETIALFERTTRVIRDEVVVALPANAGSDIRSFTLEQVLAYVLRNWRENDGTTGLNQHDVDDLRNVVSLAASMATPDINGKDSSIYQAVLVGLLQDWLHDWSSSEADDPTILD